MVNSDLSAYLNRLFPVDSPNLSSWKELADQENYPVMNDDTISFLQAFAGITQPESILELGCGFGLVAFHLLLINPALKVTGVDYLQENLQRFETLSNGFIRGNRFEFICGNAIDYVKTERRFFDWVLIDVDKRFYPELFKPALQLVKKGGYLIADNVLWQGRIWNPDGKKNIEPILEWNQLISQEPGIQSRIIPIGDGLSISKKLV